jgi:hypothetical protein
MAFDNISTAELSAGKPITNELMEKFRNRDEFLNGQVGTLSAVTISNPSFEVSDTSVAGGAANWTFTALLGGGATIDTSTSIHGAQSVQITHPGGAGNGGGFYESDFFSVSTLSGYSIEYSQNIKGGAVPRAEVIRYNRNQSTIDEVILERTTIIGTTGEFTPVQSGFLPSTVITTKTSVSFIKLRLIGGTTDHSTAGTVNFDNVEIHGYTNSSAGNYILASNSSVLTWQTTSTATSTGIMSAIIIKPGGYRFTFTASATDIVANNVNVLVNGSVLTTIAFATDGTAGAPRTFTYNFQATANTTDVNVGGNNVKRLKPGDEVLVRMRPDGSTATPRNITKRTVGVKNPLHGGAFLNTTNSTVAT